MRVFFSHALVLAGCGFMTIVAAETIDLRPVADTTLTELAPTNNLGGQSFVNAGTAGPSGNLGRNRALYRFDLTVVPAGAQITSANLILEVTGEPAQEALPGLFGCHRVLRPWGEGDKQSPPGSPAYGSPATLGEATWLQPAAQTTNQWGAPGGELGGDFALVRSAQEFIYGTLESPYTLSGSGLLEDARAWHADPATNFGWALIAADETASRSARRFGSREDPLNAPVLTLSYDPPLRLTEPRLAEGVFQFQVRVVTTGLHAVEATAQLGTGWTTLTNLLATIAPAELTAVVPVRSGGEFYRVRAPE